MIGKSGSREFTMGTLIRIKSATDESRIAVFKQGETLFSVFGDTAESMKWIKRGWPEVIGLYSRNDLSKAIMELDGL